MRPVNMSAKAFPVLTTELVPSKVKKPFSAPPGAPGCGLTSFLCALTMYAPN